jgi:hypothetical protein
MGRVEVLLTDVASGRPPEPDGAVEVVPQPPGPVAGVLAFAAHHVVAADVDPAWVHDRLPPWDLSAPFGARFLGELASLLGREPDNLDLVLVGKGTGGPTELPLEEVPGDPSHPRVARSQRYRTDVRVHAMPGGEGVLVLGRGLAGRWEAAFEVGESHRGRGLGRALARSALALVPAGEPLFVQVAPGNVPSLRAVLAAGGFTPIGGEILFPEA